MEPNAPDAGACPQNASNAPPERPLLPHTARSVCRHGAAGCSTPTYERRRPPADWSRWPSQARPRAASLNCITLSNEGRSEERAPTRRSARFGLGEFLDSWPLVAGQSACWLTVAGVYPSSPRDGGRMECGGHCLIYRSSARESRIYRGGHAGCGDSPPGQASRPDQPDLRGGLGLAGVHGQGPGGERAVLAGGGRVPAPVRGGAG